jgi:haloalkane dehalogenase
MKKLLLAALTFATLGITSYAQLNYDYADYLKEYDKAFLAKNPHQIYAIKRDNYTIHGREFGDVNSKKVPVIAAHGFPDNLHLYDGLVPYIARDRRIITFDFVGWGNSDKPAAASNLSNPGPNENAYGMNSLYKDLDAVINHTRAEKVVLVAHDLSAFPVIDWAIANPSRVEKLVILNSFYFRSKNLFPPKGIFLFGLEDTKYAREYLVSISAKHPAFFQALIEEQVNRFFSDANARATYAPLFIEKSKDIRSAFFQMNDSLFPAIVERTTRFMQSKGKFAFDKPVTIIFGTDDPYLTEGLSVEFKDAFLNSTLRNIKGAGHYVQLDNPKMTSQYILEGLRN